jgi:threonine synthase
MHVLRCPRCGVELDLLAKHHLCPRCGEPLLLRVELRVPEEGGLESLIPEDLKLVTLGEGRTPTVELGNYLLKLEFLNPTGSFKDRGASLSVSRALKLGFKVVIEDSSGNSGISTAAYSARAGLKARIYVPKDAPQGKLRLIKAFGAEVVTSETRNEAHRRAVSDGSGFYVGHVVDPFFIEGVKDISLELYSLRKDLGAVVVPVASGTLFLGILKGFEELLELGLIDEVPTLIPVEACGYSKLRGYLKPVYLGCTESEKSLLADALRLTIVPRLRQIAEGAVRAKAPYVVIVGDGAIGEALKELYSLGLPVEPSSAATYAAAKYVAKDLGTRVVVPLTGSGLKYVPLPSELLDKYLFGAL